MPVLTVIAGPNGSGKSTLTASVDFEGRDHLLDPDAIARLLNPSNPSASAIAAGRAVLERIGDYFVQRASFAVETTLSGQGQTDWIRKAKSLGYEVHLIFIALDSPEQSIARIRNRAALGRHFVPEADVRRRYTRSIANSLEALTLSDIAEFYDNSGDGPQLVLVANGGKVVWTAERLPDWLVL